MTPEMPNEQSAPAETVRAAFDAFARNDRKALERFIGDEFVWVFFDPFEDHPVLRTCSGRSQITEQMRRDRPAGGWTLVEMDSHGSRVAVTTTAPTDRLRPAWREGALNFHVVDVRDGRIITLRACLDRNEARQLASTPDESLTI
jgi:ketosteroid isomerase-like protein